jgi:twitching motility protein PilI
MANREALRELQARLAERLQKARTEARPHVLAGGRVRRARACCSRWPGPARSSPCRRAAGAAHAALVPGVANLRGGLHGVVDLAAFLGLRAPHALGDAVREQARLVALNPRWAATARCSSTAWPGCAAPSSSAPSRRRRRSGRPSPRPSGATPRGRRWQEIDLAALAAARAVSGHRGMTRRAAGPAAGPGMPRCDGPNEQRTT